MKTNKRKGISLTVLVITIIVMIILAGAILLSLNSSNIIDKANEATTKSNISNAKQVVMLANAEYELMSDVEKGEKKLRQYIEDKLVEAGFKENEIDNVIDGQGNLYKRTIVEGVVIPEGFFHVGGTKAEGLVISDNVEDEGQGTTHQTNAENFLKGNQFVWVPVENFSEFVRYDFKSNTTLGGSYREIIPEAGKDREVEKMYASVEKYKGFYVGRYEAGIAEGMTKPTSSNGLALADGSNLPQIKQGIDVWGNIPWGGTTSVKAYDGYQGDDSANGAVKVARSVYPNNLSNTRGVVSHLIYGVQWDAIMRWYKNSGINLKNSETYGNYSDSIGEASTGRGELQKTGHNAAWQKKNIYDLAGNIWEWTMEAYTSLSRVNRGGHYSNGGTLYPVSNRYGTNPSFRWYYRFSCCSLYKVAT
ncbi:MAG: hypothetical protein PHR25_04440 [Clostridia bacterium]|nr:hypothetical protein [Clostridia bacterium]MDD4376012.1 hypothetical protein [Clostridia bacterium]